MPLLLLPFLAGAGVGFFASNGVEKITKTLIIGGVMFVGYQYFYRSG